MRLNLAYSYRADIPTRLYLALPQDSAGQQLGDLRINRVPEGSTALAGAAVSCFELRAADELEATAVVDTAATFDFRAGSNDALLEQAITEAAAKLAGNGWRLAAAGTGESSFLLAQATQAELAAAGRRSRLVLGHLLQGDDAVPHAWLRLETEGSFFDCDPWFFLKLQEAPAYWLPRGLTPLPADYLRGHEGLRLAWSEAPIPVGGLPCNEEFDPQHADHPVYLWPDLRLDYQTNTLESAGGAVRLKPAADDHAANVLAAFRLAAFAGLILVALGFAGPQGWPLTAYASYLLLLLIKQGPAWTRLWSWAAGRRAALEALLFHAGFLAVVTGADTVLPQTLFALYWTYNRLEPPLRHLLATRKE